MENTVTEINLAAKSPVEMIKQAEEKYISEIRAVAERISADDYIRIVALAGPSASGKTTTAGMLCKLLSEMGEKTVVVSLDDFYLPLEKMPKSADGSYDFETVNSLDIELIKKCFREAIKTGKTHLPKYDFTTNTRMPDTILADISEKGIIIAEGLHALNPLITDMVDKKNIFKIYISVNCSIMDSFGEQLLSSRQIRLVRRALRDRVFRGSPIAETLGFWNSVVAGERKNLYCFKDSADVKIKTLHIYEPGVYRNEFLKLKNELQPGVVCYDYFMRTCRAIEQFAEIDNSLVPEGSLIREFIG